MQIHEILYVVLSVIGLVAGSAFLLHGRRKGQAWFEAFRPTALLFGISGFTAGQAFLAGTPGLVMSLSILVPTLLISVDHSRRLFAKRAEATLSAGDVDSGDPAERALAELDRADFMRDNVRYRRRMIRTMVIPGIPLIGIGVIYGSFSVAVLGGFAAVGFGLAASFITKPLPDANRLVSGPEAGEGPAAVDEPCDSDAKP